MPVPEVRTDAVKRWPAGSSKGGEFAPKAGGVSPTAVKVGDRLDFSTGVEHGSGKAISNFRGSVARKSSDGRLMVNAGTKSRPRWVVAHAKDATVPQRKAAVRNDSRRSYKDRLSPDEVQAIDAYMGENYKSINGTLREGKTPSTITTKRITALDSAVTKGVLEKDTTLYRAAGGLGANPSSLVGQTFTDPGFASTSEQTALPLKMAASRRGGVFARIKAPAGAHVGYLSKVRNQQSVSAYDGTPEQEALLPRGSQFRVTGARQGADGMWTVDMELIV